jgi:ABC-type multidrug transport system fused ATPase/permease subunit
VNSTLKILLGAAIRFGSDLLLLMLPLVMRQFILDIDVPQDLVWRPYLWAVLLFLVALLQITVSNQYFATMMSCGLQMRTAATSLIFAKGLKLSPASRAKYSTGEITNLMSLDAQKFADSMLMVHLVWAGPLQIIIALIMLFKFIGVSAIIGILPLALFIPVNLYSSRIGKGIQAQQMKAKDERILFLNEILLGIKAR